MVIGLVHSGVDFLATAWMLLFTIDQSQLRVLPIIHTYPQLKSRARSRCTTAQGAWSLVSISICYNVNRPSSSLLCCTLCSYNFVAAPTSCDRARKILETRNGMLTREIDLETETWKQGRARRQSFTFKQYIFQVRCILIMIVWELLKLIPPNQFRS